MKAMPLDQPGADRTADDATRHDADHCRRNGHRRRTCDASLRRAARTRGRLPVRLSASPIRSAHQTADADHHPRQCGANDVLRHGQHGAEHGEQHDLGSADAAAARGLAPKPMVVKNAIIKGAFAAACRRRRGRHLGFERPSTPQPRANRQSLAPARCSAPEGHRAPDREPGKEHHAAHGDGVDEVECEHRSD